MDWNLIAVQLQESNALYLLLLIPLMPINWGLEALKWKFLIAQTYKMKFKNAFASVLGGVAIGSMTPNRLGSFIGRLFWLPSSKRIEGTVHTFYSNWAQLITTIFMGGFAMIYFYQNGILEQYITLGSILSLYIVLILFFLLYAFPASIWKSVRKFFGFNKTNRFDQFLSWEQKNKGVVFLLSFLRYFVFLTQFISIIYLYNIPISFIEALFATISTFLFTTFIPSVFFGKLVIRESVAVFCFSFFLTADYYPIIVISSLTIWIVNILTPAISGSLLMSRIKRST